MQTSLTGLERGWIAASVVASWTFSLGTPSVGAPMEYSCHAARSPHGEAACRHSAQQPGPALSQQPTGAAPLRVAPWMSFRFVPSDDYSSRQHVTAMERQPPKGNCPDEPLENFWSRKLWTQYSACLKVLTSGVIYSIAIGNRNTPSCSQGAQTSQAEENLSATSTSFT